MGMFAKRIAEAKPGEQHGLLFEDGLYPVVQLTKIKIFESKKPGREGTDMFVGEFDIIESKVASRPAGMKGVANILNGSHVGAARDAISLLTALLPDVDPKEWEWKEGLPDNEQAVNVMASAIQPGRGRLVALEVYKKVSEKTKKPFTVHRYTPIPEAIQAKAAELRASVGLAPL